MSDKTATFERHATAVMQAVVIALLLWIGASTVSVRESIVQLQTQMSDVVVKRLEGLERSHGDHEQRLRKLERAQR